MNRKKSLSKRLSRQSPEGEEFAASVAEMQGGSDRVAAIMGTAIIEDTLVKTISSALVNSEKDGELFHDEGGPFSTFKRRISASYALGLADQQMVSEMLIIGDIRNQFAHALLSIDFENEHISAKVEGLAPPGKGERGGQVSAARHRFEAACWRCAIKLLNASSKQLQTKSNALQGISLATALGGLMNFEPTGLKGASEDIENYEGRD